MGWFAAAARAVVTPPPGHAMGGYVDREGVATGTLDDLECNILSLRDGVDGVAVVSLDALAVSGPLREAVTGAVASALGLSPEQVLVWASHTHSGPSGWHGEIHPVLPATHNPALLADLALRIASAVSAAVPFQVDLLWAEGSVDGAGANRHRPDGPHDRSVGVLSVMANGRPQAILYDYACHPTVLGPANLRYSADWVGAARRTVRRSLGDVPVIFGQGASGDVSTRFTRGSQDADEVARTGGLIGEEVARLAGTGEPLAAGLGLTRRRVTARPRAADPLAGSRHPAPAALEDSRRVGALSAEAMAGATAPRHLDVSVLRLGQRAWLGLGAEVFTALAADLRSASPDARIIGCADGYVGYLADADAHRRGEYEARSSWFDAAETSRIIREVSAGLIAQPSG